MTRVKLTNDFYEDELRCRCGCGLLRLHPGFADELQALRGDLRMVMTLRSACRCSAHNAVEGGKERSFHIGDKDPWPGMLGSLAVDVATPDGAYRGRLFAIAWTRGWAIGWNAAHQFLHLDRRVMIGLPQTTFDY